MIQFALFLLCLFLLIVGSLGGSLDSNLRGAGRSLGPNFEWYSPPIKRDGKAEKFRYIVSLTPHFEACSIEEIDEMAAIMTATMQVGFMDIDVEFFDIGEGKTQPVPEEGLLGKESRRSLARNKNGGKYAFAGTACRRCGSDNGGQTTTRRRRRRRSGSRKLAKIDPGDDPLAYVNIANCMTEALRIELVENLSQDPERCLFGVKDADVQVRLQLMAHAE